MIKTVIFDYGNVISARQDANFYAKMTAACGVDACVFQNGFDEFRNDFDLGKIDGATLYSGILRSAGYTDKANDRNLCETLSRIDIDDWARCNPETEFWCAELQNAGFRLGILSNMPTDFLRIHRGDIKTFARADFCVFSCEVGLVKPDEKIYRLALEGLETVPNEAVFFDDLPQNVEAAQKIGIHGVLWQNVAQAKADFEKIVRQFGLLHD